MSGQLKTCSGLLSLLKDKDSLYACIARGKINWLGGDARSFYIYDVTALFFMDELSGLLAKTGSRDPAKASREILKIGEEETEKYIKELLNKSRSKKQDLPRLGRILLFDWNVPAVQLWFPPHYCSGRSHFICSCSRRSIAVHSALVPAF